MKKLIKISAVWVSLFLFLFSTGGFSIYIHCCEKNDEHSVSWFQEDAGCCSKGKSVSKDKELTCCSKNNNQQENDNGCCENKVFKKQLWVEHTLPNQQQELKITSFLLPISSFIIQPPAIASNQNNNLPDSKAPPLLQIPKRILHQSFLI